MRCVNSANKDLMLDVFLGASYNPGKGNVHLLNDKIHNVHFAGLKILKDSDLKERDRMQW